MAVVGLVAGMKAEPKAQKQVWGRMRDDGNRDGIGDVMQAEDL
jgi:hypothetical protein